MLVDDTGPARLLDIVPGRSAAVLSTWLNEREQGFRDRAEVLTMDGFAGYATATKQALPQAQSWWICATSCTWPLISSPPLGNGSRG